MTFPDIHRTIRYAMRLACLIMLAGWGLTGAAAERAAPGTGVVTIGGQARFFSFAQDPGARCKTGVLGNRNGIVARGFEITSDGDPLDDPATLEANIYPEDWEPRGKQAHEISIVGGEKQNQWSTAGPSVVESNPQVSDLAAARVTQWRLEGKRTWGAAVLYRRDTLAGAQTGDTLVVEDATFDIHCP